LNKIIDYVLKAVITLIVSGGGYQLFDGRWFGANILNSYLRHRHVGLVSAVSDDLYREWGSNSVQFSLSQLSTVAIFLSVFLLFGLVAQVMFKPNVAAELGVPAAAYASLKKRIRLKYMRLYYWLTLIIFLSLTGIYFFMPLGYGLALVFVLIALPCALYLLLYSKDILQGGFVERFVCACLLVLLVASLVEWPVLYGREAFSPEFPSVTLANQSPDSCSAELRKGPIFLAWPSKDKTHNQFLRVCFDGAGDRFIDFFESGDAYRVGGRDSLTRVLLAFVPPVSDEEGKKAIADAETKLKALFR